MGGQTVLNAVKDLPFIKGFHLFKRSVIQQCRNQNDETGTGIMYQCAGSHITSTTQESHNHRGFQNAVL